MLCTELTEEAKEVNLTTLHSAFFVAVCGKSERIVEQKLMKLEVPCMLEDQDRKRLDYALFMFFLSP